MEHVARFAQFHGCCPSKLGLEDVRAYLAYLAHERRLSPNARIPVSAALRFLYRVTLGRARMAQQIPYPKQEHKLPVVLGRQEVARFFAARYGTSLSLDQRRVLLDLANCRTAALGGHLEVCDECGFQRPAYNSCRNRHCPKCQARSRAVWLEARAQDLLPVPYFHVVFTLPEEIGPLALQNKRLIYDLLFQAAARSLLEVAADPRHLGARIGFLAVLHTWGQNLHHHPHLHCVVPGGGLALDSSTWIPCRQDFFLPVRVLSRVFRGKFLSALRDAYRDGQLGFYGRLAHLRDPEAFRCWLHEPASKEWVVYAKPPCGGPEQVLKYLARYTHRVAIANSRILSIDAGQVRFRYKDYADGNRYKTMTLDAVEFIRRFLLHVLPPGFMRIRHYGLLANRARAKCLSLCRHLLQAVTPAPDSIDPVAEQPSGVTCPEGNSGHMVALRVLPPVLSINLPLG